MSRNGRRTRGIIHDGDIDIESERGRIYWHKLPYAVPYAMDTVIPHSPVRVFRRQPDGTMALVEVIDPRPCSLPSKKIMRKPLRKTK